MIQEIQLYDPERRPANWSDLLHPGQYAVFHSDVETNIEKTPAGKYLQPEDQSTCLVFDSLEEAEDYCEARVEEVPRLRCDIYDHTGKSKLPMFTYVNRRYLKSPQKLAYWGWVMVAASLPCFWIEWHWHGTLVVPMIVGFNLVFGGLRLVYWGLGARRRGARPGSSFENVNMLFLLKC